jgi:glutamate synthase domain-containing protein 1
MQLFTETNKLQNPTTDVINVVTEVCGIPLRVLKKNERKPEHVQARYLIMALLYARGKTYAAAAHVFRMNHASAVNALKFCDRKITKKDPEFAKLYGKVLKKLAL